MTPENPCAIIISGPDGLPMVRIAAFLWRGRRGIAWVEPIYRDPFNTMPASHVVTGPMEDAPGGVTVTGQQHTAQAVPFEHEGGGDSVQRQLYDGMAAMDSFVRELAREGLTYKQARELVADGIKWELQEIGFD